MPPSAGPRRPAGPGAPRAGEVYLEFHQLGKVIKVTAVDAATGLEVVVMGPLTASQDDLKRLAVRKLEMQLAKRDGG